MKWEQDAYTKRQERVERIDLGIFPYDLPYCIICAGNSRTDGLGCSGCDKTGLTPCPVTELL